MNECRLGTFTCDAQAVCENIPGTYKCRCFPGLAGTGKTCGGKYRAHQGLFSFVL